ncbi:hypothetical protein DERP_003906 [Dermatophagoides pteronyssinus]|uniref:Secreted protein n=1 Tax=Dermatophagoides pteronyssinus TaxID=6956 RepID=A0ABQ8J7N5_DERPT|nr:hypothetical protein DERP_003906 [Dermatophagoides pteronyssinus]
MNFNLIQLTNIIIIACAATKFCYKLHFLLISNVRNDQEKQPTLTKYGPSITTTLTYCTKTFLPPPIYFRTVHVVFKGQQFLKIDKDIILTD